MNQCHTEAEDPSPAAGPGGDTEDGRAEVSENPPPHCAEARACGSPLDPAATAKVMCELSYLALFFVLFSIPVIVLLMFVFDP